MTYFIPLAERFLSRISKPQGEKGCWLWTGYINKLGYGRYRPGGQMGTRWTGAHQLAYKLFVGPLPDNTELDHLCRVRHCVNPDHLEAVSHRTNILRGNGPCSINARKTHCSKGHPFDRKNTQRSLVHGRHCRACNADGQRKWLAIPGNREKAALRQKEKRARVKAARLANQA